MNPAKHLADRVRDGDPIPAPIALFLSALTPVQRAGMAFRRMQKVHRVNARVISFGNIAAGGTGKTPAVIERARKEIDAGRRVAVLTRGYAAPSGSTPHDSTELGNSSPYAALGDEAALILQKVPGVIVVKNGDRVAGARRAIMLGCDTLILDDGFQQLRLARDEDIVLIDATNPFGNGHIIPRGILRESPRSLARATQIFVTHADTAPLDGLAELAATLVMYAPKAGVRDTRHVPTALRNIASRDLVPLEWLRGRAVSIACGIANPARFKATVLALGATVSAISAVEDHAPLQQVLTSLNGDVVITEKDAVRLTPPYPKNVHALEIELQDL